ncbi:MAG TPA: hypothetical protein VFG27_05760 [Pseudomonadales bacterium]|nr:hypothetical protein [Pseudomonadales bacterium]
MSLDEILILLLALATGVLLFMGLAQALEGRPRQRPTRRLPHLLPSRRSFSAEERVLEHRARSARTGVSPFATPPPPPVPEAPRAARFGAGRSLARTAAPTAAPAATPSATEDRSPPEQISLLDAAPSPESAAPAAPVLESPDSGTEPLLATPDSVAPPPVSTAAPVEEGTVVAVPGAPIPEEAAAPVTAPADAMSTDAMTADPLLDEPEPGPAPAPAPAPAGLSPALVAECARLLKSGHPAEVRALAEPLLTRRARGRGGRTPASYDRALLWCLVGLAHRDAGEEEAGLRAAFEQGVRALPRNDASGPDPAVVALANSLGGQLLASGEAATGASGATLAELRLSVGLLRGVAVAPPGQAADAGDAGGPEASGGDELPPWGKALQAHLAVERARDALANACVRKVDALLERGDRDAAHRWIQEVAGWDEPDGRLQDLEEPYWKAVTGEVTRLTGVALESTVDLDAAMRTLQSAEAMVRDLPEAAASSPRLPEMRRRLWWSYTKLGVQRLDAGDEGPALEPLYHALRLAEGDADRETETRHSLAQALDALATRASNAIAEWLRVGGQITAEAAGQALCRAIDRALAEGVSQEELAGALDKRQHVMGLIAQADAR